MTVTADTLKATVVGFLVPVYERTDPATGERLHGLGPTDFHKVRDGYACARCLAEFSHYTAACILCGWQRDLAADIGSAPDFWQQSIDERENDRTPYAKPTRNAFDEMMTALKQDRDVDHVALSDLARKSRARRS